MEVIILEAQEFEHMMTKIESFADEIKALLEEHIDKGTKRWISGREACRLLAISLRTLQTYRDNGTLPYTQIGHKVFFRMQDIERIMNEKCIENGKE